MNNIAIIELIADLNKERIRWCEQCEVAKKLKWKTMMRFCDGRLTAMDDFILRLEAMITKNKTEQ